MQVFSRMEKAFPFATEISNRKFWQNGKPPESYIDEGVNEIRLLLHCAERGENSLLLGMRFWQNKELEMEFR